MKTLLYCPLLYEHNRGTWPPTTSATWYYEFQSHLWDWFNVYQNKIRVIWNAGLENSSLEDPIQYRKSKKIKYTTWKIDRALANCDMVFVDFPSSVLLDAAIRNVPGICITLRDHNWIRPGFNFVQKANNMSELFARLAWFIDCPTQISLTVNQVDWLKEIVWGK